MMGMLAGLARPEEEARRGAEASSSAEELERLLASQRARGVHTRPPPPPPPPEDVPVAVVWTIDHMCFLNEIHSDSSFSES